METVRYGIACLRIAAGRILQGFSAVQIFPVLVLAHGGDRLVVGIDLRHCDIGIGTVFRNRRNAVDDDIGRRIGIFDFLNLRRIAVDKRGGIGR